MNSFRKNLKIFLGLSFYEKIKILITRYKKAYGKFYYRMIFAEFGHGSFMGKPLYLKNPHYVRIGENVHIWPGIRLEALQTKFDRAPELIIEDDVEIGPRVQIISHCKIIIRRGAGVGPNCFIMDVAHPILDRTSGVPLRKRFTVENSFVEIGEGALIGAGTFIAPNVRIGARVVIGANSVVRKNIPDDCVASGNPASVQLRYDSGQDKWLPNR